MRAVILAPVPGLDLGREYGHHHSPAIRTGGLLLGHGGEQLGDRRARHGTVTSEALPTCIPRSNWDERPKRPRRPISGEVSWRGCPHPSLRDQPFPPCGERPA